MKTRNWQIGIFGTFDVENYGDLLFPLLAEAELTRRLGSVTLHRFSYHERKPPEWPFAVTSLAELPRLAPDLDGILIGGGFLIRFDKEVAPGYAPATEGIHHPTGYWLTPALIAVQLGIPLIWNAPGMHCNALPAWADPLMNLAFQGSSNISVRDEPTRAALSRFADPGRINVVPDTAFGIPEILQLEPSAAFQSLRDSCGLGSKYIIVQAARGLESFLDYIRQGAHPLREYSLLALPVGPVLGDDADILEAHNLHGFARAGSWPHPLLLAELISRAAAVAGHSYHLAITALAMGVPAFTSADLTVGKYSALQKFETLYPLPQRDEPPDCENFLKRLGPAEPSDAARAARAQVAEHWDRVAATIEGGRTNTQIAANQFWQALPSLLEEAAPAEATAQMLETLRASTSWKVTAPMRFLVDSWKHFVRRRSEK